MNEQTGNHAMRVLVRGGGDLASGSIIRMLRAGWQVLVTELANPMAVRRLVSYAQAVYSGEIQIEETRAKLARTPEEAGETIQAGMAAVMIDPDARASDWFRPDVIVDGRMMKSSPGTVVFEHPLVIGLGPGFTAGVDCHAVVETNRGPYLGRVYWKGSAQPDTGIPERVGEYKTERVLRALNSGIFHPLKQIGDQVRQGQAVAEIDLVAITAPFDGIIRGLLQDGLAVRKGEKVGDIDPRGDSVLAHIVSDKALAVGGGVLEAVLAWKARIGGWR